MEGATIRQRVGAFGPRKRAGRVRRRRRARFSGKNLAQNVAKIPSIHARP
jgi:hypothetical protein